MTSKGDRDAWEGASRSDHAPNCTLDILLPFFGDPGLLREAVESVIAQTDPQWRLVVVDDCYPDQAVADWFASLRDSRIEYHRNRENLGANRNYTEALGRATGDLVVFMGADDRMARDYVRAARETFDTFPADVAIYQPGVRVIDEHGREVRPLGDRVKRRMTPGGGHPTRLGGDALAASLLAGNWTYFPSICWRREAVEKFGFRREFNIVQDLALLLDLVADGHEMVIAGDVTFDYRRHSGSDSSVRTLTGQRFTEERALFSHSAERFAELGWMRSARAARRHFTSRMNAASLLPASVLRGHWSAVPRLVKHALG